jgi:hypothetical protein
MKMVAELEKVLLLFRIAAIMLSSCTLLAPTAAAAWCPSCSARHATISSYNNSANGGPGVAEFTESADGLQQSRRKRSGALKMALRLALSRFAGRRRDFAQ